MKRFRILAVTLSFVVLLIMLVGCGPKAATFPDENLEAAIRDALDKPAGEEITDVELANLTTLWALFSDITDLTGLEYCTNLTELNIYGNQISDISPLVENNGLGEGDEVYYTVYLEDNNLDLTEGSEDMENIKALEDRGVVVHY